MKGNTNARILPIVGAAMLIACAIYAAIGTLFRGTILADGRPPLSDLPIPLALIFLLFSVPSLAAALVIPSLPPLRPRGYRDGFNGLEPDPDDPMAAEHGVDGASDYAKRAVPLMMVAFALAESVGVFGLILLLLSDGVAVGYSLCGVSAGTLVFLLVSSFAIMNRAADLEELEKRETGGK
jgi:hypothetical protein